MNFQLMIDNFEAKKYLSKAKTRYSKNIQESLKNCWTFSFSTNHMHEFDALLHPEIYLCNLLRDFISIKCTQSFSTKNLEFDNVH